MKEREETKETKQKTNKLQLLVPISKLKAALQMAVKNSENDSLVLISSACISKTKLSLAGRLFKSHFPPEIFKIELKHFSWSWLYKGQCIKKWISSSTALLSQPSLSQMSAFQDNLSPISN